VIPVSLYGSEYWTLTKQEINRIETAEMSFLKTTEGYHLLHETKNDDIRENYTNRWY